MYLIFPFHIVPDTYMLELYLALRTYVLVINMSRHYEQVLYTYSNILMNMGY